ncbi:hypothetical protein [Embleya sp. NBC_00896]|uniref:hypothetical protein n=1 Tax=Embleya sp. NBC_00896 TaxID=2975961 RepID=UPI002F908D0C|nr:hypothetical protein OG928_41535 [Embleya sp. NBC_00896]
MQETLYVRTTYATGDPAKIESALDALRREAPALLARNPGYRRYGLFADRELGKIQMGSWWESANARSESDRQLRERRAELLAPFADTVTVDDWEAVAFTPAFQVTDDAYMRMGRLEFKPSDAESLVQTFRDMGLPNLEAIDGLEGAVFFIDRAQGRAAVGALLRDRAALLSTRGPQSTVRGESLKKAGVTLRSIEEFQVVLLDGQRA